MAILSLTGTAQVLGSLPATATFPLAIVRTTASDNGDGTWSVTAETTEDNIPALTGLGCTVRTVVTDADQLEHWQVIDTQINQPPSA